jgi:hypothetical protein
VLTRLPGLRRLNLFGRGEVINLEASLPLRLPRLEKLLLKLETRSRVPGPIVQAVPLCLPTGLQALGIIIPPGSPGLLFNVRFASALAAASSLRDLRLRPRCKDEPNAGLLHLITQLPRLERLSLASWGLDSLPAHLSALAPKFSHLDLAGNFSPNSDLAALQHLTALSSLALCKCNLWRLPVELTALAGLQELDVT